MDGLIQVIGAFFAILAFSVVIGAPRKYLVYCGLTAAIGWFVYLATLPGQGTVMANFWGAVVISLTAHIFARIFKAPVTVFLIPGILILVPGSYLYRAVYNFIAGDQKLAGSNLTGTIQIAGMIALAVFITDSLFSIYQKRRERL